MNMQEHNFTSTTTDYQNYGIEKSGCTLNDDDAGKYSMYKMIKFHIFIKGIDAN